MMLSPFKCIIWEMYELIHYIQQWISRLFLTDMKSWVFNVSVTIKRRATKKQKMATCVSLVEHYLICSLQIFWGFKQGKNNHTTRTKKHQYNAVENLVFCCLFVSFFVSLWNLLGLFLWCFNTCSEKNVKPWWPMSWNKKVAVKL